MFGSHDDSSSTDRSEERVAENTSPARQSSTRGLLHQVRSLFGDQEALRTAYLGEESPETRPRPPDLAMIDEVNSLGPLVPGIESTSVSPRGSPRVGTPPSTILGNSPPPPQRKSPRLAKRPTIVLPTVRDRSKQASPPRPQRPTLPIPIGPMERVDPRHLLEECWLRAPPNST